MSPPAWRRLCGFQNVSAVRHQFVIQVVPRIERSAIQRTQVTFLPVTKCTKATMAAEFRTRNVRAASASRDRGPIFSFATAAKLNP